MDKKVRYYVSYEVDNFNNEVITSYRHESVNSKEKFEVYETRLETVKEISKDVFINSNYDLELMLFKKINEARLYYIKHKVNINKIKKELEGVFNEVRKI